MKNTSRVLTKEEFYDSVKVRPLRGDMYELLENIHYKDVIVPKGYITNGADIPRIFWSFWPPNRSDYLPAVIVHDYMTDLDDYKKADLYFKEILELLEVGPFVVYPFYWFVRLFHKIKYND